MTIESVIEKLESVGIKVKKEQVAGWSDADMQAATGWADLVLSAEKQRSRGLEKKEKKIAVPQKPDFLRKY